MMSATIDEDERRPVVRQWLRTAELQGERRYENRINNRILFICYLVMTDNFELIQGQ